MTSKRSLSPSIVMWDCDGVLAQNSEELAMPVAAIVLNEQMKLLHPQAPQFDVADFTVRYAGGHFKDFVTLANDMLKPQGLALPGYEELDVIKCARTIDVLTREARPAPDLAAALLSNHRIGMDQVVVTSSELNRVLPCIEKIEGFSFGNRVYSAADTMKALFGEIRPKPQPDIYIHAALDNNVFGRLTSGEETVGEYGYFKAAVHKALKEGIFEEHRDAFMHNRATRAIAVEDSTGGVGAAVRAGIPVIGYSGSTHIVDKQAHAAKLLEKGAVAVYDNFVDVATHIARIKGVEPRFEQRQQQQQAQHRPGAFRP